MDGEEPNQFHHEDVGPGTLDDTYEANRVLRRTIRNLQIWVAFLAAAVFLSAVLDVQHVLRRQNKEASRQIESPIPMSMSVSSA